MRNPFVSVLILAALLQGALAFAMGPSPIAVPAEPKECLAKAAAFLGVELNSKELQLKGTVAEGECSLFIRHEEWHPGVNTLWIQIEQDRDSGQYSEAAQVILQSDNEFQNQGIFDCRVENNSLHLDFSTHEKHGWKSNHRYKLVIRKSEKGIAYARVSDKESGFWVGYGRKKASCTFE
ncbi:MAG: hypothetical protein NDJ90_05960 [Oligoflexia bacterium]|nr:hypothetical protein [Oligoflexia bacterium]